MLINAALYISILFFLYNWGQWPLVGSYYLRYTLFVIILVIVLISVKRFKAINRSMPIGLWQNIRLFISALLLILFLIMNFNTVSGRFYHSEAATLEFPLKHGTYYVGSGGSNKSINNHMRNVPVAQQFALDINKLGKYKSASKRLLSNEATDHYIFADTIYCPCNGTIKEIKSNLKDNESVSMEVKPEDGTGNFVNIRCDGDIFVFIPHLKQFSLLVSEGMDVQKGRPLGLVGLSGFSQEPHLHIQAATYTTDSSLIGIPIKFNGKYYSRNDLIKN